MSKLDRRKIICIFVLVSLFGLGMIIQNFFQHSKASIELEQLNNEINQTKENNKQLEEEIENLHKKIEEYKQEEAAGK